MHKKTAVIDDVPGFLEWLGTTPLILAMNSKKAQSLAKQPAKAKTPEELEIDRMMADMMG